MLARQLGLLLVALGHAAALREDVGKDADVGQHDEQDHPKHLAEAGYIMAAEQVARNGDEQPEPQDEHKYGKGVGDKVGECETTIEQHELLPSILLFGHFHGVLVSDSAATPATTLRPTLPSMLTGCKAIWLLLPPTSTLAPAPTPTVPCALAPP